MTRKSATSVVIATTGSPRNIGQDEVDVVRAAVAEDLLKRFLAGRPANTRQAYADDLADFAAWRGLEHQLAVAQLLDADAGPANGLVLDYLNHLRDLGRSRVTINRRLAALRSLTKLARLLGLISWSIEVSGEKLKRYRDTRGPGLDGVRRLLAQLERQRDGKAIRDRAIVRLLFDLALRRGELVGLDLGHLDLAAATVAVLGKGDGERQLLTLPHKTMAALQAWLDVRGLEPGPLFVNFDRAGKGKRLTATSVYRMVRQLGERAGVRARPHGLRHGAITAALDLNGGDVRAAQRFSRHLDVRTLTLYDDNREGLGGQMARLVRPHHPAPGCPGRAPKRAGTSSALASCLKQEGQPVKAGGGVRVVRFQPPGRLQRQLIVSAGARSGASAPAPGAR